VALLFELMLDELVLLPTEVPPTGELVADG
jgi:hypothetical protein